MPAVRGYYEKKGGYNFYFISDDNNCDRTDFK